MRNAYAEWIKHQGLADNTIQAQLHRAGRVEECYGDLDEHYDRDNLRSVIADLRYSVADSRSAKPNPSKIPFDGDTRNNLSSYKSAVERYCRFRREVAEDEYPDLNEDTAPIANEPDAGQLIGLERDMQSVLRRSIEQLEDGLVIIDDGAERSVPSIKITSNKNSSNRVFCFFFSNITHIAQYLSNSSLACCSCFQLNHNHCTGHIICSYIYEP